MSDAVFTDDGCRLWATRTGHGRPLVFCHGGPGLWDMFDDLAAMLVDVASVVRWDQRGCGRSERRGPFTVARYLADLDAVRDRLAGFLAKPASTGGTDLRVHAENPSGTAGDRAQ